MLKDDKSYPFLALTKEEFPRILYTRHPQRIRGDGAHSPTGTYKQVVQLLEGISESRLQELRPQGCLAMHIGLCAGPCIEASYAQRVKNVRRILSSDAGDLIEELATEMDKYSKAQNTKLQPRLEIYKAVRTVTS